MSLFARLRYEIAMWRHVMGSPHSAAYYALRYKQPFDVARRNSDILWERYLRDNPIPRPEDYGLPPERRA